MLQRLTFPESEKPFGRSKGIRERFIIVGLPPRPSGWPRKRQVAQRYALEMPKLSILGDQI